MKNTFFVPKYAQMLEQDSMGMREATATDQNEDNIGILSNLTETDLEKIFNQLFGESNGTESPLTE